MTDLTKLAQLAEQHSSSYASPHHFVLSVAGLRSIIAALAAQPGAVGETVTDAVCDALIQAWTLGQYYHGYNDRDDQLGAFKAQETHTKFVALLDKTRAMLAAAPEAKPAQQDAVSTFNAAIDFAITQGTEAAAFLDAWRHGDTSEWPEFAAISARKGQP